MTGFDDILKSAQWHQSIQKSLGLTSQLSEMMKAQEQITKSLSGVSMIIELAKSMQKHHRMFENPTLSAIEAMTKGLSLQAKFAIPQTTLDAITSINRQHDQLFGNLRSITEAINKNQAAFNQINSWQFAISGISGQLAAIAASQKKWNLIDDFEEITEEAVSLNERIFDENGVTKEGLNELKAFFQRIEIKVDKIDADANALFWKVLALLSFALALLSEARNWLPKPEYATKQEVETVIKEQFGIYEKKLKDDKEFRITSRNCKVMSKPRLKSLVIEKLPIDFEVTVLQVNHKWVYVTYFSPIDNLPQTGWIMKKYLDKPE
ncbi:hypothetical protein Pedsa_0579 [Pseudopedobacter saltans DSM 12145]|uniref:Uncharacterized protein n=1 Tax=Pseudopedobacter saltans (strain ATCC 51119 / DSM 12145 / JCM 21818 / CCUG 39354 / LMG 10337 / NBRC 100064 / NCIMB 13643) TaxID=762903 RepID=F0S7D3_PSESL|nr:hypothetical protein [Pseudopedobacter saltans]ADY51158.1 hypothetical protein Pedsa_0579 [Pseudopedobacter saltans DSM 12145]